MRTFTIQEIIEITQARVLNTEAVDFAQKIHTLVIDSRQAVPDSLFVTIVGERNDAHVFLRQVYAAGCRACLVSRSDMDLQEGMVYLLVKDTVEAAQKLAAHHRKSLKIPFVGITGSVGKTTTREMVAAALSAEKNVFKTPANFNSQIGVPLTMLSIEEDRDIAVLEMGISTFGEMEKIAAVVLPDCAIMTNIGTAHIENLKSQEGICCEKLQIQNQMSSGSKIFLNAEDLILRDAILRKDVDAVYYGIRMDDRFEKEKGISAKDWVYAEDIRLVHELAHFQAYVFGENVSVQLSVHGRHQIFNALAALGVAKLYGVDLKKASQSLTEFRGFKHRQQIMEKNGRIIIDDTYNASPASMKAAIEILSSIDGTGRRVAVLADMKELGEREKELHFEVGEYLAGFSEVDCLITLGELGKWIAEGFQRKSEGKEIHSFMDADALFAFTESAVEEGDIVLFKGSNSMRLMDLVERIWQSSQIRSAADLEERDGKRYSDIRDV